MPNTQNSEQNEDTQVRFVQIDSVLINRLLDMKLSAAEWSLYMYLIDFDPFGDRYKEMPKLNDILMRLGISKATFYRAIAEWVREEFREWMDLALSFGLINGKGVCFGKTNRRPAIKASDKHGQGVMPLEKWLKEYPLEALHSWLKEVESGIHAAK